MTTKIENGTEPWTIEEKRFYFPTVCKHVCSQCGEEVTVDFANDYLSYPEMNSPIGVNFYCSNDHMEIVFFLLKIELRLAGVEVVIDNPLKE